MSKKFIKKLEKLAEQAKNAAEKPAIRGGREAALQKVVPGLSKLWYENQAAQFVCDFGKDIEDGWEEKAVNQFCNALKVTSGVVVDKDKLLEAIKKALVARQDKFLKVAPVSISLQEISARLRQEALVEERLEHVLNSSAGELIEAVSYDDKLTIKEYYEEFCGFRTDKNVNAFLQENYQQKRATKKQWDNLYDETDINIGFV